MKPEDSYDLKRIADALEGRFWVEVYKWFCNDDDVREMVLHHTTKIATKTRSKK